MNGPQGCCGNTRMQGPQGYCGGNGLPGTVVTVNGTVVYNGPTLEMSPSGLRVKAKPSHVVWTDLHAEPTLRPTPESFRPKPQGFWAKLKSIFT